MRFIGSMIFYSKIIDKLHISLNPFCTLLHDDVFFEWTSDLDKLFNFNLSTHSVFQRSRRRTILLPPRRRHRNRGANLGEETRSPQKDTG